MRDLDGKNHKHTLKIKGIIQIGMKIFIFRSRTHALTLSKPSENPPETIEPPPLAVNLEIKKRRIEANTKVSYLATPSIMLDRGCTITPLNRCG